jgi:acyl-CoA thioesterase-1
MERAATTAQVILYLAMLAQPVLAAGHKTVLVFGDSLSAAHGPTDAQGWVALTAKRMQSTNPDWRVVNASVGGETSAGGASRINAELERSHPDLVVIELGINDGRSRIPLPVISANLAAIIRASKATHAKILLIGIRLRPDNGSPYCRDFEQSYALLSKQYGTALLPLFLEPIETDRNAFQPDNLHPVAAVQPKLRDHVWTALQPLLK